MCFIYTEEKKPPPKPINPCVPSPCGPNSECRVSDSRAVCSCTTGMLGAPPNCRPECLIHQDCPNHLACVRSKCRDPCVGSCGFNAQCTTHNHQPVCSCLAGYEGDPFSGCSPVQGKIFLFFGAWILRSYQYFTCEYSLLSSFYLLIPRYLEKLCSVISNLYLPLTCTTHNALLYYNF